jgi:hypothetical protein
MDLYFNYSYGNEILNPMGPRFVFPENASNHHAAYNDYWTVENPNGKYPNPASLATIDLNNPATSVAVQDGSYLRLQTLTISYSLPKNLIHGVNGNIYFTGKNLWLLTNYNYGYDPDVNSVGTNSIIRGYDGWASYPQARSFILGVNFEF